MKSDGAVPCKTPSHKLLRPLARCCMFIPGTVNVVAARLWKGVAVGVSVSEK